MWLDHERLKVAREMTAGEQFEYVFDFGDHWLHRCTVAETTVDPLREFGMVPLEPLVIWGWGSIPDQYGRRRP